MTAQGSLLQKHSRLKARIARRLAHFESVGKMGGSRLFEELAFCILTPQSKALSCDAAIMELKKTGLLMGGSAQEVRGVLSGRVRFHNKKAEYLVAAREMFGRDGFRSLEQVTLRGSERSCRQTLLHKVKGLGMKEASHYLRNVGRGRTLAILDRHILRNLLRYGAIKQLPKSLTLNRYLEIERKMGRFCRKIGIPMAHLDLLFWAEGTGKIFK